MRHGKHPSISLESREMGRIVTNNDWLKLLAIMNSAHACIGMSQFGQSRAALRATLDQGRNSYTKHRRRWSLRRSRAKVVISVVGGRRKEGRRNRKSIFFFLFFFVSSSLFSPSTARNYLPSIFSPPVNEH
jgi:hypothetical protein